MHAYALQCLYFKWKLSTLWTSQDFYITFMHIKTTPTCTKCIYIYIYTRAHIPMWCALNNRHTLYVHLSRALPFLFILFRCIGMLYCTVCKYFTLTDVPNQLRYATMHSPALINVAFVASTVTTTEISTTATITIIHHFHSQLAKIKVSGYLFNPKTITVTTNKLNYRNGFRHLIYCIINGTQNATKSISRAASGGIDWTYVTTGLDTKLLTETAGKKKKKKWKNNTNMPKKYMNLWANDNSIPQGFCDMSVVTCVQYF